MCQVILMTEEKSNLPNVWNKANKNDIPEGALWFNPDEPEKLRNRVNGKWEELDPFEDLEENTGVTGIDYSDQQLVGVPINEVIPEGSEYSISVPVGGTANTYEWTLASPVDTAVVAAEITSELIIPALSYETMGVYTLSVTNELVQGLVLTSEHIDNSREQKV